MSRRRIYINGKPEWAENEPHFRARVSKYGQGNLHSMTLIGAIREVHQPRTALGLPGERYADPKARQP
jgi:hypothetical protein